MIELFRAPPALRSRLRRPRLAIGLCVGALLVAVSHAAPADPIAGDFQLAGKDLKGPYHGTASVSRRDDGRYTIDLALSYEAGAKANAYFLGDFDGKHLSGKRGKAKGLIAALDPLGVANATSASYTLSPDGLRLEGGTATAREALTRTPSPTTGTANGDTTGTVARIVILHTNDIHGQVVRTDGPGSRPGLPALIARIRAEREAALAQGAGVLTLDAGDIYAGTPEGDLTHGQLVVDLLNLAGLDAMTVGNHEFDQGAATVKAIALRAKFPILGANVFEETTKKRPSWLAASARRKVSGLEVDVIGILTSELKQVTTVEGSAGIDCEPEAKAIERELAANADAKVHVLLSHVGAPGDEELAGKFKGRLAAIVGGHTHTPIAFPKRLPGPDGVLVAQAGAQGRWLGKIELEVERSTGAVKSAKGRLIPVGSGDPEAKDVRAALDAGAKDVAKVMDVPAGSLTAPLRRGGAGSSPLGNLIVDLMRAHAHADCAFENKTGIRADLEAGPKKRRDLYLVFPFENRLVTLDLAGKDLKDLLEHSLGGKPALEASGLTVRYDSRRPEGSRIEDVRIGGAKLDPARTYKVVTHTFLADGGDGHVAFTRGKNRVEEKTTLLDLLRDHLEGKTVTPDPLDPRYLDVAHN